MDNDVVNELRRRFNLLPWREESNKKTAEEVGEKERSKGEENELKRKEGEKEKETEDEKDLERMVRGALDGLSRFGQVLEVDSLGRSRMAVTTRKSSRMRGYWTTSSRRMQIPIFTMLDLCNPGISLRSFLKGSRVAFTTVWDLALSKDASDLELLRGLIGSDLYQAHLEARQAVERSQLGTSKFYQLIDVSVHTVGLRSNSSSSQQSGGKPSFLSVLYDSCRTDGLTHVLVQVKYDYVVEVPAEDNTCHKKVSSAMWTYSGVLRFPLPDQNNPIGVDPKWTIVDMQ